MARRGCGSRNNNVRPSRRVTRAAANEDEEFVRQVTRSAYTVDSLTALNYVQRREIYDNLCMRQEDRVRCNAIVRRRANNYAARRSRNRREAHIVGLRNQLEEMRDNNVLEEVEYHLNVAELHEAEENMRRLVEEVTAAYEAAYPTRRFIQIDVLDGGEVVITYELRDVQQS